MTGPEHYREAERLLKNVKASSADEPKYLALAQVHATLALVASTALAADEALPEAWYEVLDQ